MCVTMHAAAAAADDEDTTAAVEALVESISDMFPQAPLLYLRIRCQDLVGKETAIQRFTEELLESQEPPPDWRQIYATYYLKRDCRKSPVKDWRQIHAAYYLKRNCCKSPVKVKLACTPHNAVIKSTLDINKNYTDRNLHKVG